MRWGQATGLLRLHERACGLASEAAPAECKCPAGPAPRPRQAWRL